MHALNTNNSNGSTNKQKYLNRYVECLLNNPPEVTFGALAADFKLKTTYTIITKTLVGFMYLELFEAGLCGMIDCSQ